MTWKERKKKRGHKKEERKVIVDINSRIFITDYGRHNLILFYRYEY